MQRYLKDITLQKILLATSSLFFVLLFFFVSTKVTFAQGYFGQSIQALGDLAWPSIDAVLGTVIQGIGWLIYTFAAMIVSLSGGLLDIFIRFSLDSNNFGLDGIAIGWRVIRDVVNMIFIFILLYVAIMTILQIAGFQTKRILVNLVLVGIFINFSYFITGFIIDIGNILAGSIYNAITTDTVYLGGKLNEALNLGEIIAASSAATLDSMITGVIYILSALLLFVAAFVFIAAGFMFVIRTVILMFLLMISPAAFVAFILPNTAKYFNQWLGKLISNTFVAPVFLLLIAIVLVIADSGSILTSANGLVGPANPLAAQPLASQNPFLGVSGLIMNFIILIGLMVASLSISQRMAGEAASMGSKAAGRFTGIGVGATALLGRNTLGRYSARRLDDKGGALKEAASKGGAKGWVARQQLRTLEAGSKSSFDVRNSKKASGAFGSTVGATLGVGGIQTNVGSGGGAGGYQARIDARQKREEDFAKSLGSDKKKEKEIMDKAEEEIRGHEETYKKADDEHKAATEDLQAINKPIEGLDASIQQLAQTLTEMEKEKQAGGSIDQAKYDQTKQELIQKRQEKDSLVKENEPIRSAIQSRISNADAARKSARSAANARLNEAKRDVQKEQRRRADQFSETQASMVENKAFDDYKKLKDDENATRFQKAKAFASGATAEGFKGTRTGIKNFVLRTGRTKSEVTSASKSIKNKYGNKVDDDLTAIVRSMNVKGGKYADGGSNNDASDGGEATS